MDQIEAQEEADDDDEDDDDIEEDQWNFGIAPMLWHIQL